jgi:hypothetical protein
MSKLSLEQKNKIGLGVLNIFLGLVYTISYIIITIGVGFRWYDFLALVPGILFIAFGIAVIRSKPHKLVIYHNDFLTGLRD